MMNTSYKDKNRPPNGLKIAFKIHFLIDYLIALPLFLFPVQMLNLFGWDSIDPVASRISAAALFGIGGISLVAQKSSLEIYEILLKLKLIWSAGAIIGILISIIQFSMFNSFILWLFFTTFLGFNIVWVYWIKKLRI
ncbi:hypothetical protein NEF87_003685 [Candidatus Lokiarchaeum ossiferum]|uniref:DUF2127 domain-containing protein n=1 Tax=Candidatus Lokiarchaeum ossiferum TaxID=2951803 RepID=A0ABY6HV62_9ARCH|nr:hypothetical protein NEF87_003685 [Candidatus Lokiarchaeum sp. B-35]